MQITYFLVENPHNLTKIWNGIIRGYIHASTTYDKKKKKKTCMYFNK